MNNTSYRALSPTAILGYGFPEHSFVRGIEKRPDLIAVDAGSTDPGPYYLGAGKSFTSRLAVKRDLELILGAALELSVPCIIGTAGGCGARGHVAWTEAIIHVYGKDGVMGGMEPEKNRAAHELGLIIEVIAPDQERANTVCSYVRSTLLHYGYPGRVSTAGNLAVLYSPSDITCGDVYQFNLYHLMEVDDPVALFPMQVCEVGQ
jgi:hypothetical protein